MHGSTTRREMLASLGAIGAGAFASRERLFAQAKKKRVINVHHHLTAPAYVKFLQDNHVRDFPNKSAAQGIEEMDKAGIDTAVCSIIGPGIHFGNLADTRRMARACNEYAAKLVSDYPGRFGIFTVLPLPDIDGSLKEIEYGYETLKADGVYLFTNWGEMPLYGDKYIGDAALAPIYQELNRRKAVIYTHPKDAACCRDIVPGVNGPTIEYGTDTTRAIASVLFSGTAAKYPDVKFIWSHAGGTMPFLASRFLGGTAAYLEEGGKVKAGAPMPRTRPTMPKGPLYELQKMYWDTANAANPISLGALRRMLPFEQILFGSDFPFSNMAEDRKLLVASGTFSGAELEALAYDNVIRILPKYAS